MAHVSARAWHVLNDFEIIGLFFIEAWSFIEWWPVFSFWKHLQSCQLVY